MGKQKERPERPEKLRRLDERLGRFTKWLGWKGIAIASFTVIDAVLILLLLGLGPFDRSNRPKAVEAVMDGNVLEVTEAQPRNFARFTSCAITVNRYGPRSLQLAWPVPAVMKIKVEIGYQDEAGARRTLHQQVIAFGEEFSDAKEAMLVLRPDGRGNEAASHPWHPCGLTISVSE